MIWVLAATIAGVAATLSAAAVTITPAAMASPIADLIGDSTPSSGGPSAAERIEPLFTSAVAFADRWNGANAAVHDADSTSAWLPLDSQAFVLRPAGGGMQFFDMHFGGTGYVGGLVSAATGAVFNVVVAGEPDGVFMRSAAATLLSAVTDDAADRSGTVRDAYTTFTAEARPGRTGYLTAGSVAISMISFDGVEPDRPWVSVVAGPAADEKRSPADAVTLTHFVGSTAVPAAPVPLLP